MWHYVNSVATFKYDRLTELDGQRNPCVRTNLRDYSKTYNAKRQGHRRPCLFQDKIATIFSVWFGKCWKGSNI
jgi:hypothetical protein